MLVLTMACDRSGEIPGVVCSASSSLCCAVWVHVARLLPISSLPLPPCTRPHTRPHTHPHTQGQPFVRPVGAFGQKLPQNVPSPATSASVKSKGVVPHADVKDFDHLAPDGLPYPGAIIWPGQVSWGADRQRRQGCRWLRGLLEVVTGVVLM